MVDVTHIEGKRYPKEILELTKDTREEKIEQVFDQWAATYEKVR